MFAETEAGVQANMDLHPLLQTCLVDGLDGYGCLQALLVALPRTKTLEDFEALPPCRIALS